MVVSVSTKKFLDLPAASSCTLGSSPMMIICARQAGWSGAEIWVRIDWPNTDHHTLPLCFGHREKLFRDKCPGMSSGVTIAQEPCGKELEPQLYLGVRHTQTQRCGAMES